MPYTAVPTDPTVPVDGDGAGYAATEFRALKAYIQTLVVGAAAFKVPVRQTVLAAACAAATLGATPVPNNIVAGTGLQVDFKATGLAPTVMTFANGFDANGSVDYLTQLSADIANLCGTLKVNNTNFLYADFLTASTVTGGNTAAPPQYGYSYDRTQLSCLTFSGTAGSTTFLDDNGNVWAAQGGAKHQVNQIKFGAGALGGGGAANAMNGTTDYIRSAEVLRFMEGDSWSIRGWVYPTALPTAGNLHYMAAGLNAAGTAQGTSYLLGIFNNGGTIRFGYYLSQDNASWGIASNLVGTTLPVINTWYYVELTFDGANYRLYVNGVQEQTNASTARVSFPGNNGYAALGSGVAANTYITGYMDGWEHLPYCDHGGGVAYAVPTADPSIVASAPNFFDITAMKMKRVTAASAVAGTDPTFTQVSRIYLGEAVTSGIAVTGVTLYALKGEYVSPPITPPAASTITAVAHNIGVPQVTGYAEARFKRLYGGWKTGQRARVMSSTLQFMPTDAINVFNTQEPFTNMDRKTANIVAQNWALSTVSATSSFVNISGLSSDVEMFTVCKRDWGRS